MNLSFDSDRGGRARWVEWLRVRMAEALRLARPGSHAMIWALPRTSHWTATALEDAGWEIRDVIVSINGQGFPKSLDVSKSIDAKYGVEREVIGVRPGHEAFIDRTDASSGGARREGWNRPWQDDPEKVKAHHLATAPATDAAQQWQGWGTALKPSNENWILARKPLDGTVAANVLAHGTGALNVDACRVGNSKRVPGSLPNGTGLGGYGEREGRTGQEWTDDGHNPNLGRYPPNLLFVHHADCRPVGTKRVKSHNPDNKILDEGATGAVYNAGYSVRSSIGHADADGMETVKEWQCVDMCPIRLLDEQAGERKSGKPGCNGHRRNVPAGQGVYGNGQGLWTEAGDAGHLYGDSGPVSRYFPQFAWQDADFVPWLYCAKAPPSQRGDDNTHPTLKNLDLMRWLCRLVCPSGGVILDNFMGSGTTGKACILEGFRFIGIESDPHYFGMAERGIAGTRLDAERPHRPKPKPARRKQAESLPLFDGLDPS